MIPPFNVSALDAAMDEMARASGVLIGAEYLPDEPLPPGVVLRAPRERLPLAGVTVSAALDLLLSKRPGYTWSLDRDVFNVRPVGMEHSFLEQRVFHFALQNVNLMEAFSAVHRLFDAQYPHLSRVTPGGLHAPETPEQEKARVARTQELANRRFSVNVEEGTIWMVLNAIVRAHGEAGWIVDYRQLPATYDVCRISFRTVDGGRVVLEAGRR